MGNIEFEKLTPKNDVTLGIYKDALEFAFLQDDLRNIAMTGAYGAGKSSVLSSFEKIKSGYKFLHISLAHFEEMNQSSGKKETDEKETGNNSTRILEGKILNQLLHQIPPEKIGKSGFSVKKNDSNEGLKQIAICMLLAVMLSIYVIFPDFIKRIFEDASSSFVRYNLSFLYAGELRILAIIGLAFLGYKALAYIIKMQKDKRVLKSIKLKDVNFEIFEEKTSSYFDKYMDEVLYLFAQSEANVVVFEDLDRFDDVYIFEKLREINYLLNNGIHGHSNHDEELEQSKPIRFLYLLKDDIFVSKDRTKFFDFIIPIVPFMDGSNSVDQFMLKLSDDTTEFDKHFLKDLSLYVDDMRLLNNIINEYRVYKGKLQQGTTNSNGDERSNTNELNQNKLLAIIVYKNLFPKDFAMLQLGQGYVFELLENKHKLVDDEKTDLEMQIKQAKEEINKIENEWVQSKDELQALYFHASKQLIVDGKSEADYSNYVEFIKAVIEHSDKVEYEYYYYNSIRRAHYNQINDDIKALNENAEFQDRLKCIQNQKEKRIHQQQIRISGYESEIVRLDGLYLHEVFEVLEEEQIDLYFKSISAMEDDYNKVAESSYFQLIKYLVRQGLLDEMYPDFMTAFMGVHLSVSDKNFLRAVADHHAKVFNYPIQDCQMVINGIRTKDWNRPELRNIALTDYLMEHDLAYKEEIKYLVDGLSEKPYDFLQCYLMHVGINSKFTLYLNKYWNGVAFDILENTELTVEAKRKYAMDTICTAGDDTPMKNINILSEFICSDSEFLSQITDKKNSAIKALEALDIHFKDINIPLSDKALLNGVYENNLYVLSETMIYKMMEYFYTARGVVNKTQLFTHILSDPNQCLAKYVMNWPEHVLEWYVESVDVITDEESVALQVINNTEAVNDLKVAYLVKCKTVISKVDSIRDIEMQRAAMDSDRIKKNLDNVLRYFCQDGGAFDDTLVRFTNSIPGNHALKVSDVIGSNNTIKSRFFNAVIVQNGLNNDKYEKLIQNNKFVYNEKVDGIPKKIAKDKMDILIRIGVMKMKENILELMRENYPDNLHHFVTSNWRSYVAIITDDNFSHREMLWILGLNEANVETKLKLLMLASDPVNIVNKGYPVQVVDYIIENLINEAELPQMYQTYNLFSDASKQIIANYAIKNVTEIVSELIKIDETLFVKLMSASSLVKSDRILLMISQVKSGCSQNVFEQIADTTDVEWIRQIAPVFKGHNPKVETTSKSGELLSAMKVRHWISSYAVDKTDGDYYRVQAKRK
jgi:hypothetical protein